ncbi:hypothetical protein Gohar_020461 [Gossypium harknessii]|uniref:RNase H type-1 domain-containing protein n=1 Tax=Gossypium harknessii TaxID=34285 RepID=A0A7J9HXR9_9ROSI|nr:hypothetical protein [Gossypium harknessii]
MILVTATYWSVWLARNELVFDRKWITMNSLVFHSKMQALIWVRSIQEELRVDERSWWICPFRSWCGKVSRDSDGVARALFSGPVTVKDSITAEIGAVIIALDVFLAIGWKGKSSLIIESGSNEVFCWFENKGLISWLLHPIFKETENKMVRVGNVSFSKA